MSRFSEKYSDEQRRAVAGAMLGDFGRPMTARAAVEAAARGELGLPPFTMAAQSAYGYRDAERERRVQDSHSDKTPRGRVEDLVTRLLVVCESDMARLERESRKAPMDTTNARSIARTLKDLDLLTRRVDPPRNGGPRVPDEPREQSSDLIGRLAAEAHQEAPRNTNPPVGAQGTDGEPPATMTGNGNGAAGRAEEEAEEGREDQAPVGSRAANLAARTRAREGAAA